MESMEMKNLFGSIYNNRRVLITGHSGFKGSWLAFWLRYLGANVGGYSLPPNTTPSHYALLGLNYETYWGDINIQEQLLKVMEDIEPEIIFHLAAQPIVIESFSDPLYTFNTNVIGSVNLLECCRKVNSVKAIIVITSDKVYENSGEHYLYNENDRLGGVDPYSASKSCVELICNSYRESILSNSELLLASARAGNVIGGGDWAKYRLIPDIVRSVFEGSPLIIRNPNAIRPWQHVLEPLSGYLQLGRKLLEGSREFATAWNFGPESENCITVSDLIGLIRGQWDQINVDIIPSEFKESSVLMLDYSKAKESLNWEPVWGIEQTILNTIEWYKKYYLLKEVKTMSNLQQYISDSKKKKLIWAEE
jgi:CDP-glucose 4,6-dehydratase